MGVTQFEATDARMAFPCFDEPNIKATFNVTMTAPETYDCLSNMPIVEETKLSDGKKKVKFDKTPIMSTYLVRIDRPSTRTSKRLRPHSRKILYSLHSLLVSWTVYQERLPME